jgi:hypothetical protein
VINLEASRPAPPRGMGSAAAPSHLTLYYFAR